MMTPNPEALPAMRAALSERKLIEREMKQRAIGHAEPPEAHELFAAVDSLAVEIRKALAVVTTPAQCRRRLMDCEKMATGLANRIASWGSAG